MDEILKLFAQLGITVSEKEIIKSLQWSRFMAKRFRSGEKELTLTEFKRLMENYQLDIVVVKKGSKIVEIKDSVVQL